MKALAKFGFAGYVGKVNMDRNCAAGLLETTEETIAQTRLWLEETKDGIGAIYPILTPRYFPSCTESCLEQLGELAEEYHVPVQSHLSEGWMKLTGCTSLHRILIIMRRPMTVLVCLDRIHGL